MEIKVPVIEVNQPIGTFFIGKMPASIMKKITKVSERKLNEHETEVQGIQRKLRPDRQKEITDYIKSPDATFPNAIILSFKADVTYNQKTKELIIPVRDDIADIIDGQHRLSGFSDSEEDFDLIFSGFIDLDLGNQAMLFATINGKQIRVNPSHVYDLYELNPNRSPIKTCHTIVKTFNETEGSPWFKKIKMLGGAIWEKERDLSQSAFVKALLNYITKNPIQDETALRKNKPLEKYNEKEKLKYIFRDYFIEDKDEVIYRILNNYFSALEEVFKTEWTNREKQFILTKTTGFNGFMKLLRILYLDGVFKKDLSKNYFNAMVISLKSMKLTSANYQPGAVGEKDIYKDSLDRVRSLLHEDTKKVL